MSTDPIWHDILRIPEGHSFGLYRGRRYAISRASLVQGKSLKVFARELGGQNVISLNYYCTGTVGTLKPCEMPREKVVDFLKEVCIKLNDDKR